MITRLFIVLAVLVLATGCGGARPTGPAEIQGKWLLTRSVDSTAVVEQRLAFAWDGTFRRETVWYDASERSSANVTAYNRAVGRYRLDGPRLFLEIWTTEEWQRAAGGERPQVTTAARLEWAEHGRVRIKRGRLVHKLDAPVADDPVSERFVYRRIG